MAPFRDPAPLRGPPGPVAPSPDGSGASRSARPWPPFVRLRPLRPVAGGLASLRAALPAWAPAARGRAGPGSGPFAPFGSLRAAWPLAGRLRPSLAPSASPGGPRCGVAGPGVRRACLGVLSGPVPAGLWFALGLRRAPCSVALCGAAGSPVPPAVPRRFPLASGPLRGCGSFLPPGGAAAPAGPFFRPAPPGAGVSDRAAAVKGQAERPLAALDRFLRPDTGSGGARSRALPFSRLSFS